MQPQKPNKKPTDMEVAISVVRLAADFQSIPDREVKAVVRAVMLKAGVPMQKQKAAEVVVTSGESNVTTT